MKLNARLFLLPAAVLLGSLACGGGGGGATAQTTGLSISADSAATDWRLVRDAASTPDHLVLDLMAPTGTSGQGITLILTTDPTAATWSIVSGTSYAVQTQWASPQVNLATVNGASLQVLIGQGGGSAVSYGTTPVLKVALDKVTGALTGAVTLTVTQAAHLGSSSTPAAITVSPGTLTNLG